MVETVAQALKLPYVAIALKQDGDFKIAASYGLAGDEQVQLPLIYQGETLGQLLLSTRSPNEPFTPGEQRLLRDIARHIGVTAHTVLLTQDLRKLAEDLQRSREELVKSREEERRRLRRDLHDELGPQLASLKLNLDVARNLVSRDPRAAEALLVDLRSQSQSAIADIRRLVFDLRPPALDELGLIGAIQEYTRQIASQDGGHAYKSGWIARKTCRPCRLRSKSPLTASPWKPWRISSDTARGRIARFRYPRPAIICRWSS